MPRRIAIIGSSDLGQLLSRQLADDDRYVVVGYFDDYREAGEDVAGIPILGGTDDVEARFDEGIFDAALVGVGYRHFEFRRSVFQRLADRVAFEPYVHPSCCVTSTAKIGAGAVLLAGCTLDHGSEIGDNVLLNVGCTIAHDSRIGEHSFLGPGVTMAGFCDVGQVCFLGIGTVVIDNVTMIEGTRTGAGAVVTKSTSRPGLYVGVPARRVKD